MIKPNLDQTAIVDKTRELCQLILNQPAFLESRKDIHAFLDDEKAQNLYRQVAERGRELEQLQVQGLQPDENAVEQFEKMRFDFLENPVAKNFIEAQQMMNEVQETVNGYVNKAFELGRVPTEEDLEKAKKESCGCGSSCGC
ncbi:MAG: YlbF family regulator [Verrucomicrobiota bacterium]